MNLRALISTGQPFDVLLPTTDAAYSIDPAVELIPCSVVESYVRNSLVNHSTLDELHEAATVMKLPVSLLGTPPPLPESAVRERLMNEPHMVGVMSEAGMGASDAVIVPDRVRATLWKILISTYKDFAAERAYQFLELPDSMVDSQGMLESDYWGEQATHANEKYGAAALDTIIHWANGSLK